MSCAAAAACTTTGSQPPSPATSFRVGSSALISPMAMERATAETLSECVSRLCTTVPAPACGITWVTAESREK